jgi:hypothetical protein
MKFPMTFKCTNCDEDHDSEFMAAFVLDTAGNWFFDLGEEKGWTGVTEEQYEALMDLLAQRVHVICDSHAEKPILDLKSGERILQQSTRIKWEGSEVGAKHIQFFQDELDRRGIAATA